MDELDKFLEKFMHNPGYKMDTGAMLLTNFYYSMYNKVLLEYVIEEVLKETHESLEQRQVILDQLKSKATAKAYEIIASIATKT